MTKPIYDKLYDEMVIPHSCPVCVKCWLIVQGRRRGVCVHGGPYKGYVEIPDARA